MFFRKKYHELLEHLPRREFTILIGPRQSGKSTLLQQLAEALKQSGETAIVFNLERKDLLFELNQNPENIFKYLPAGRERRVFALIDEVQYLTDASNFLKLLYDEHADHLKIIATGSSAFYIDRQFRDSLAGRKKIFELPTLDFEEFLEFTQKNEALETLRQLRTGTIQQSTLEPRIWIALEEYLTYGGYPAVVLEQNTQYKIDRLMDLRDSFVKRDIQESGVSDETRFFRMMMILASQTGSLLNTNELSNTLRITHATADQFIYVLQKCFHISVVRPFFQNLRKELVKMPKVYFNDFGMRNVLMNYFAPIEQRNDKGALLENFVFRRLTEQYSRDQVKFWRTADGNEVDFVIEETAFNGRAVEVKFNSSEASVGKYKKFMEVYPTYPLTFYTWHSRDLLL